MLVGGLSSRHSTMFILMISCQDPWQKFNCEDDQHLVRNRGVWPLKRLTCIKHCHFLLCFAPHKHRPLTVRREVFWRQINIWSGVNGQGKASEKTEETIGRTVISFLACCTSAQVAQAFAPCKHARESVSGGGNGRQKGGDLNLTSSVEVDRVPAWLDKVGWVTWQVVEAETATTQDQPTPIDQDG